MSGTLKIIYPSAAVLWTAVVFYVCLMPSGDVPTVPWLAFPGADKLIHVVLFGVLSGSYWMAYRAISGQKPGITASLLLAAAATDIGILIEILQWVMPMGRSFEVWDILVNALAATLVALAFFRWYPDRSIT
jgi:hypothetical protein